MKEFLLTQAIKLHDFIPTAFAQPQGGSGRMDNDSIDFKDLNPFGAASNLFSIFQFIINFLMKISFPIAAIMIMWGAFLILTAGGKPENLSKGRAAIVWAVVGLIIILFVNAVFVESCSPDPTSLRYSPNCSGPVNQR